MIAFHGDKKVKAKYLNRVRAHARADEIVKGTYWENGKGCCVGCITHCDSFADVHKKIETDLGIPLMLARLSDTIFEGLPDADAKKFPARFVKAPKVGADLSTVGWKFLYWLLTEEVAGRNHPLVNDAVAGSAKVIEPLTRGEPVDESAARSARSAAYVRMADKLIQLMEDASLPKEGAA